MRKILLLFCLAPLLMAHTCEEDYYDDYPCTVEARAGLNVSVSLGGNANVTFEGITVTARDGNFIEDLMPIFPDTPQFSGVYERAGSYVVTVSKEGYQTYVSDIITVNRDRCHVIPQQLSVDLIPNP